MRLRSPPIRLPVLALASVVFAATTHGATCGSPDLDGSTLVDGGDVGALLAAWGPALPGADADLNLDGAVDAADLGIVLAAWGEPGPIPGTLPLGGGGPTGWISGGPQCGLEPQFQVHWYNDDTVIMRQSLCTNFEGPFIVLLFGSEKVLMMDTGAGNVSIGSKVTEVINTWKQANGVATLQLIGAHTHGHGDHVAGNGQIAALPNSVVVGNGQAAVKSFFGIATWPTQLVTYDLGDRVVDIIPIPGHQSAHIAFYDRETAILFTGDTLYPGRLYISAWNDYKASIQRLVDFVADKPVCHVIGTHIEMSNTPGDDFPVGSTSHPDEHELELTRAHLLELNASVQAMGASPVYQVHDDFIIFPLVGAQQGSIDPPIAPWDAGTEATALVSADGTADADARCCLRPTNVFEYRRLRQAAEGAAAAAR